MHRRLAKSALLVALAAAVALGQELPAPDELLAASIARHDPEGVWQTGALRLVLREARPDGRSRDTTVLIDHRAGRFEIASTRDGDRLVGSLDPDGCLWSVNGSTDFSDEIRNRHRLTCDRLEWLRDYYAFLWGLPMKLRDPGTRLGERVVAKEFEGEPALELRVSYDEEVGGDVWYVYFDPATRDMIGYRFYHDESANDGEYITLEGVEQGAGLRLPRVRAWYTHRDHEHLGTDSLISIGRP